MAASYKNTVLQRLEEAEVQRLHLHRITLERSHVLEVPGREIEHTVFIEEGIGSMTAEFEDGSQVEVGMFGCESIIGISALMGTRRSLNNIYMQVGGWGYMTSREVARSEFKRGGNFHDLALRFVQAQLMQTTQTAGCNARHGVEQRLSRWLLLCHDRAHSDVMDLTQEFLANVLGVDRPAVSIVAARLQEAKLIEYHRGKVRIVDRTGLEHVACECYRAVRDYLNSYTVLD